ncbi:acyltransferase, putative [Oceanicola granulosus HTCC2516]|uniref:Acyltransferase, putative n=1 Tax=Oceanicola granulosus (strain ATCC BAA-861 / DSM 15982 / KCTC 12143 / HTCC2516) TaxID=314256 RepID=Q2CEI0_OCEGH|nr:lysophospholipid acyltransferase family protein [Oceanicola granulosus]EAR51017.1 acyltransferase, putative [Oceanicola granulosus HTCC2516]
MSVAWHSDEPPPERRVSAIGVVLAVLRAALILPLLAVMFSALLLVRLVERPLFELRRPITPTITQLFCRAAIALLGIGYATEGRPMRGAGAVVANHSSWLDIFVLNAGDRVYFVSKSEIAGWPGIGWLARANGTVFIARDRREAPRQVQIFRERLATGHRLLFFPEGTSTDGRRLLPFKPTLFGAFFDEALRARMWVQPVSLRYSAPPGADPRLYGWWGEMPFGPHLLATLTAHPQGSVKVIYHPPLKVADFPDRKALARACEAAVRGGLAGHIPEA